MAITPHQDHVERRHREIPIDRLALRNVADAFQVFLQRLPKNLDPPTAERQQSHAGLDQRGFSSAVRPDDADETTRLNREVDTPQHRFLPVGDGQVVDLEGGRAHLFQGFNDRVHVVFDHPDVGPDIVALAAELLDFPGSAQRIGKQNAASVNAGVRR